VVPAASVRVVPPFGNAVGGEYESDVVLPLSPVLTQPEQLDAQGSVGRQAWLVQTVSQYRFAPETEDQLKVGVVETPVAPFDGPDRVGAESRHGFGLQAPPPVHVPEQPLCVVTEQAQLAQHVPLVPAVVKLRTCEYAL
jgi:hypothetical protein